MPLHNADNFLAGSANIGGGFMVCHRCKIVWWCSVDTHAIGYAMKNHMSSVHGYTIVDA